MLRLVESLRMSPNIGDYVTYNRLRAAYAPGYLGAISISPTGGAYGDPCIIMSGQQLNPGFQSRVIPGGPFQTGGISFRVKPSPQVKLTFDDVVNNVSQCWVVFDGSTGIVTIGNSSGTLFTSNLGVFPVNALTWVEVLVSIGSGTSGSISIKLPSTTISLNGVSTQSSSRGYYDATSLFIPDVTSTVISHHFHWWDTTGIYNNSWLGDRRVFGLLPAMNGDTNDFTPNGLSSNYLNAAQAPPNGADYNASGTVGAIDLYKVTAPSGIISIGGAQVSVIGEKDDSGARSGTTVLKSGGTIATGATIALPSSLTTMSDMYETDPSTGVPILPAALPNLQFGGEVAA